MDVEGRRDFWAAIRRDVSAGRTVMFATHYLEDAYADRIALLRKGQVMADGTAAQVKPRQRDARCGQRYPAPTPTA